MIPQTQNLGHLVQQQETQASSATDPRRGQTTTTRKGTYIGRQTFPGGFPQLKVYCGGNPP